MSHSHLIEWFDRLLFGNPNSLPDVQPPASLRNLILRMEADNVPWQHMILESGLTAFPYEVHGDLCFLINYLEEMWLDERPYYSPPAPKTRVVSKFWDELQILMERKMAPSQSLLLPAPSKRDDEILREILNSQQRTMDFEFESPKFWGEIARKFIHLNRPMGDALPLPDISFQLSRRAAQLYEVTCRSRGQYFDPLNGYFVPRSEYVNSVHWQTSENLETFIHDRPTHPLSVSVQLLLKKSLDNLLQGRKCSVFQDPQLDNLLHNIRVVHESIAQVPHENAPPKLIDVFQRLLALCHRDGLWEKDVETEPPKPEPSLLYLTERLRIVERERDFLWKHVI